MPEEPQTPSPQFPGEPQPSFPNIPDDPQQSTGPVSPPQPFQPAQSLQAPVQPDSGSIGVGSVTSSPTSTQTPSVIGPSVVGASSGSFMPGAPTAQMPSVTPPQSNGGGGFVSSAPTTGMPSSPRKSKKFILPVVIAVAAVLLLAGGYFFAFYLPNTPSHVYSSGLANSGLALDKLIAYSKTQAHANYKSVSLDGSVHVKSPSGSYDVTLSGAANKGGNADLHFNEDALGEKFTTDVLSIMPTGDTTPDIYLRVSGIKHFLDSAGLNSLDYLDGQWIVIDHTLIDTYLSNLKKSVGSGSSSNTTLPTYAEAQDALTKAQTVNKQYLFTTNPSKAVLTNEKFIGKETDGGRSVNHYKVGYNKAHLQAYVTALGSALDSSTLNDWSKSVNSGKSLSQAMNFSSLEKSIKNAKSDYTFDMWVDVKTKLISKLTFTDPSDKSSVFTVTQGYTGGTKYPFGLSVDGKDSATHNPEKVMLNVTLDTATNKLNTTFSSSMTASDGTTTSSGDFNLTPSNNAVKVTVPAKAKSFTDILVSLGLGSLVSNGTLDSATQTHSSSPFAITE